MHKKLTAWLLAVVLLIMPLIAGCQQSNSGQQASAAAQVTESELRVHFIDVGQADSILVQLPDGQNMLVDAGNNDDGQTIVDYIKKQGVKRLDYVVATHPHEDHIGGMDTVIQSFPVGKVYAPKVTNNTKTFEDFLLAVKARGLKITPAKGPMAVLNNQNGLAISFVAPIGDSYDDLNDWSVVTKIQYGKTSFLLTGDAEFQSESEMLLHSPTQLKADVLKVGHHGSRYSTTSAFLKAVSPMYAVISVGSDNDYGHPHQETLKALDGAKVKVYRTDLNGTVIAASNGQTIMFSTLKNTVQPRVPDAPKVTAATNAGKVSPAVPPVQGQYIGNENSKKFHRPTCSTLPAPQNRVYFKTRDEAVRAGYAACKVCKP